MCVSFGEGGGGSFLDGCEWVCHFEVVGECFWCGAVVYTVDTVGTGTYVNGCQYCVGYSPLTL